MAEKGLVLPEGVRPIMISKPNFELLLREGRSFEEYFRFEEETPWPPKRKRCSTPTPVPTNPAKNYSDETAEEVAEKSAEEEETPAEVPAGGEAPAAELKEEEETSEE